MYASVALSLHTSAAQALSLHAMAVQQVFWSPGLLPLPPGSPVPGRSSKRTTRMLYCALFVQLAPPAAATQLESGMHGVMCGASPNKRRCSVVLFVWLRHAARCSYWAPGGLQEHLACPSRRMACQEGVHVCAADPGTCCWYVCVVCDVSGCSATAELRN